jgi:hypothetical protein
LSLAHPSTEERIVPPEIPTGLTSGRLEGISVPDLMWAICRHHRTGVLVFTRGPVTKRVYVQDGRIVFSASSDANDRLGEMLLRDGVVGLEQLEQSIARLHTGKRLGALLVEAGHLTPENLVKGVLSQVRCIVLSLFNWDEGQYQFQEGPLPTDEVITLQMKTSELLLEGIRQIPSFTRIRRSVGSARTRYRLAEGWSDVVSGLPLSEGERMLLSRIGESSETIEKLCTEVFLSNFEIYQALWAFRVLGVIQEAEPAPGAPGAVPLEGRIGPDGLVEILVRICRGGETGVLTVSRGAIERTIHIREGKCIFATSNRQDDGLVAHLLRRGVISLRDREECSRRLLSNKRVGTILLEMGTLDEADLSAMVREQLSELLYDTLRWEEGDFVFAPGELPTIEEITLETSLEDLVATGIRRITSWSRVLRGCGPPEAGLTLTGSYLSVLDRMKVGSQEYEIVSSLQTPRTVLELCRESSLGDFRVCQILWSLKLLGALRETTAEELAAREPLPILVADLPAESSFEVTRLDEMIPARGDHTMTIKPSEWSEAMESAPVAGPAWKPEEGRESLRVSASSEESGEVITDLWRLAAERPPAPEPPKEAAPPAPSGQDLGVPPVDDPRSATQHVSADDLGWNAPAPAPAEDPTSATQLISAAEVARALAKEPPDDGGLELGEPGTGVDASALGMEPAPPVENDPIAGLELDYSAAPRPSVPAVPKEMTDPPPAAPVVPQDTMLEVDADEVREALASVVDEETASIPREMVEASLEEPPSPAESAASDAPEPPPVVEAEPPPPWDPPADLDGSIARFNNKHKLVYRLIRSEIGAGATNFVRSCGEGGVFASAELMSDGTWEPAALKTAICEARVADPGAGLEGMLQREVESLRALAGEARIRTLVEQLNQL